MSLKTLGNLLSFCCLALVWSVWCRQVSLCIGGGNIQNHAVFPFDNESIGSYVMAVNDANLSHEVYCSVLIVSEASPVEHSRG